jgi:hypothetical protein
VTSVLFQQLRTHIQELEDVKDQISEEDQNEFNQIIQPIQERILQSIESFESVDPNIPRMLEDDELSQDDDYITITQTEVTEAANEVWTELHTELEELKGLSRTLLEQVQVTYRYLIMDMVDEENWIGPRCDCGETRHTNE